ncbi:hypothetical protein ABTL84_18930, partial [Acinetobacter baumannii]
LAAMGQQANPPKSLPRIIREIDAQGLPNEPGGGDKVAVLETSLGRVVFMFLPGGAPNHVANFKALAEK